MQTEKPFILPGTEEKHRKPKTSLNSRGRKHDLKKKYKLGERSTYHLQDANSFLFKTF